MATTELPAAATARRVDPATFLIDTDVHEALNAKEDLVPYLEPVWQRYITEYAALFPGVQAPSAYPYAVTTPGPGCRLDWMTDDASADTGRIPIFGLDQLRTNLFEGEGVSLGILCGAFYPSNMVGNYEFAQALASAYNDWQIEHWLDPEPRLRGSVHVVAHDPIAAAREIDRVAAHPQIVQVHIPNCTDRQYGDPRYRPIFAAAARNDLVVTLHHDLCTQKAVGYPRYWIEWHMAAIPQATMSQLTSMICNGVFDAFPELKVVFLESGVGWVPWFMWRMDEQYRQFRIEIPWVKRLPREPMRDSVRIATQPMSDVTPRDFLTLVEMADADRMYVFSTDYPHYDADSADQVLPPTMPEALRRRIRYEIALETYPRLAAEFG